MEDAELNPGDQVVIVNTASGAFGELVELTRPGKTRGWYVMRKNGLEAYVPFGWELCPDRSRAAKA